MEETQLSIHDFIIADEIGFLVVNKPPGLRTIIDGYHKDLPYLTQLLKPCFGQLWVVHRLDKDTSGIVVFAKSAEVHRELNLQFQMRKVKKTYHALIIGTPPWDNYRIELPLIVDGDRAHRTKVSKDGKSAVTELKVITCFEKFTLVTAEPTSGYTHQIRAHLEGIGFPILFDPLYNGSPKPQKGPTIIANLSRLALHAFTIQFNHPITHHMVQFTAPYPQDFNSAIEKLKTNQ